MSTAVLFSRTPAQGHLRSDRRSRGIFRPVFYACSSRLCSASAAVVGQRVSSVSLRTLSTALQLVVVFASPRPACACVKEERPTTERESERSEHARKAIESHGRTRSADWNRDERIRIWLLVVSTVACWLACVRVNVCKMSMGLVMQVLLRNSSTCAWRCCSWQATSRQCRDARTHK